MTAFAQCALAHSRSLRVKFILPALTEATDPYWRPIKYSLFPPLGLATLAAYLSPDDHAVVVDEHVQPLTLNDAPDLVVIQVYITNAYRAYKIADHYRSIGAFVCLGGLHVTSLPAEAAAHPFVAERERAGARRIGRVVALDHPRDGTPQLFVVTSGKMPVQEFGDWQIGVEFRQRAVKPAFMRSRSVVLREHAVPHAPSRARHGRQ